MKRCTKSYSAKEFEKDLRVDFEKSNCSWSMDVRLAHSVCHFPFRKSGCIALCDLHIICCQISIHVDGCC